MSVNSLDGLLDNNKLLRMLDSRKYDPIPPQTLSHWCALNGRYGLPTKELVWWLRDVIGRRKAIEIGSGRGDLAHMLDIPATDSRHQANDPFLKLYYAMQGNVTIRYPDFVETLDAKAAIEKYQPEVVVASWVTQWADPDLPYVDGSGFPGGVKEDEIVAAGITYVLIGAVTTGPQGACHLQKKILQMPHEVHELPFLRSRTLNRRDNRVWIWNRR